MADGRYTVRDLVAENPVLDHAVPFAAVGVWFLGLRGWGPPNVETFLVGLATVSALVLTAATFVCALTYQSEAPRVVKIRTAYGEQIRRNWTSIFLMCFLASVAPLVALLFIGSGPVAPALAVWSVVTLSIKSARTLYWLRTMLFMQQVEDVRPSTVVHMGDSRHSA